MIFGDNNIFAIHTELESGDDSKNTFGNNIAGRICFYINNHEIGDINEPSCWLRVILSHLSDICDNINELWDESLAGLSDHEAFDLLNNCEFNDCIGSNSITENKYSKMHFLTNRDEEFDRWKGLICRKPESDELTTLIYDHKNKYFSSCSFDIISFQKTVQEFENWLTAKEHELVHTE